LAKEKITVGDFLRRILRQRKILVPPKSSSSKFPPEISGTGFGMEVGGNTIEFNLNSDPLHLTLASLVSNY